MPLGANTIIDVRSGGSDTLNGGCFDPGQSAGMFTDGAATVANTASPVFTSASYNFVAGDVGAWLYIHSGTTGATCVPGWYPIASVAANAATLSAAVGAGYESVNRNPVRTNTVIGIANGASPTAITWTIDYSQQTAAQVAFTDLASAGAGLTVSSALNPFGKQWVGNSIVITGGTNFTAGRYVIASVAAAVATVVGPGNITTGVGASGTGGLGGALATPGQAGSFKIAGMDVLIKAATYSLSGNTVNTAGCQVSDTTGGVDGANPSWWVGWDTVRTFYNSNTTWPTINANAQSSLTLFTQGAYSRVRNLIVDGNGATTSSVTGFVNSGSYSKTDHIKAQNCEVIGIDIQGANAPVSGWKLSATGCSGTAAIRVGSTGSCTLYFCEAYANTTHGFLMSSGGANLINCIASGNTGAAVDGFSSASVGYNAANCVAYGNGRDGFNASSSVGCQQFTNCISEANGASGWSTAAVRGLVTLINCAGYNNTSGNYTAANLLDVVGFVAVTDGSVFTNAASGDFSLNNTALRGALLRAAGFPGLMPRGLTTGYRDIGAVQHADPVGGATTVILRRRKKQCQVTTNLRRRVSVNAPAPQITVTQVFAHRRRAIFSQLSRKVVKRVQVNVSNVINSTTLVHRKRKMQQVTVSPTQKRRVLILSTINNITTNLVISRPRRVR